MKTFVFFYDRYKSATTSIALRDSGIDHYVMLHKYEDLDKFKRGGTIQGAPIVTDNDAGLAYQRNSALDLLDMGEWAVFMSDDFLRIRSYPKEFIFSKTRKTAVAEKKHGKYINQNALKITREEFDISFSDLYEYFPKLIEIAEANSIHLIGFSNNDNPQALENKFSTKGLVDGRIYLLKKSTYKFDPHAQSIDDYAWTAENLVRHGKVLTLNWVIPYFSRYTSGGFGSITERHDLRKKEASYLVNKYSPVLKFADKKNFADKTHIKFVASEKNIMQARANLGIV
jgi:hypothetical protein